MIWPEYMIRVTHLKEAGGLIFFGWLNTTKDSIELWEIVKFIFNHTYQSSYVLHCPFDLLLPLFWVPRISDPRSDLSSPPEHFLEPLLPASFLSYTFERNLKTSEFETNLIKLIYLRS